MLKHPALRRPLIAALCVAALAPLITMAAPSKKAAPPKPKIVTAKELKQAIAAQQGKVVLINVWATWCPPCVAEFPDIVKLEKNYRKKNLVVLAVSVDEPKDRGKVEQFIRRYKVEFQVFVSKSKDLGSYIQAVDPKFGGAIPVTYVLDKKGKRSGQPMVGLQSYKALAAAVDRAMK